MIEALKKLDRKFLIIAFSLIIIPILLIIFLAIIQGCSNKKINYSSYENKMITAATSYFNKNNLIPTEESGIKTVSLDELIKGKYIKSSKKLLNDTCTGSVIVRRNGSSIDENNGGFLNYIVDLKCQNYSTTHLIDKLKEDITTSDSGLYANGDSYIFKGDNPKNYINFYGRVYRIMSMDSKGILKLISEEPEHDSRIWDNKFNTEVNYSYGKNIYKDSAILKSLINDYNNSKKISKSAKEHIVAYDSCVGKRKINNSSVDKNIDCSEILKNQVISLINVSDYSMASLDPECKSIYSRSCNNYNYLYRIANSTWTMNSVSDNTYDVIFMSGGLARYDKANIYNQYNIVIHIDGNELYTEGMGTETNPYVLK